MEHSEDPTVAVCNVLNDLGDVVHVRDMYENGGLTGDPLELDRVWARLVDALHSAARVMQAPQQGQGLASLWLKAVSRRAAGIEKSAQRSGLRNVLFNNSDDLYWLVTVGWEDGHRILGFGKGHDRSVAALIESEPSPLAQLRQMAADLDPEDRDAVPGAGELGKLILRTVNELEVSSTCLEDIEFCEHIVSNVGFPPVIASPPLLDEPSMSGLQVLISRLSPEHVTTADKAPQTSYSSSKKYPRDKWIYEHVHLQDYQTLSKMLEKVCSPKKWKFINSRNGLKVAADRYADFHGFTRRRFPDDRTAS